MFKGHTDQGEIDLFFLKLREWNNIISGCDYIRVALLIKFDQIDINNPDK